MTDNKPQIEVEDYVIRNDGTVLRWMGVDQFLERISLVETEHHSHVRQREAYRRMMEDMGW